MRWFGPVAPRLTRIDEATWHPAPLSAPQRPDEPVPDHRLALAQWPVGRKATATPALIATVLASAALTVGACSCSCSSSTPDTRLTAAFGDLDELEGCRGGRHRVPHLGQPLSVESAPMTSIRLAL